MFSFVKYGKYHFISVWLIINPDTNKLINVTLAPIIVKLVKRFGFKSLRKHH